MVDSLRQDYGNRWKIYDEEALKMFDESKKQGCPKSESLENKSLKIGLMI